MLVVRGAVKGMEMSLKEGPIIWECWRKNGKSCGEEAMLEERQRVEQEKYKGERR